MLTTEAEAKTKICPKTYSIIEMPEYRQGGPWNCAASGCMAWRWHEAPKDVFVSVRSLGTIAGFEEKGWTRGEVSDQRSDGVPTVRMSFAPERRTGYCGLAGQP